MVKIVERPTSTELLADDGQSLYGFDGTPYKRPRSLSGWKLIKEAPCVSEWFTNPGNYRTYYAAISVVMIFPSGEKHEFCMGDNIAYLRSWIEDASKTATVSVQYIGAFGDRNAARAYNLTGVKVTKPTKEAQP